MAALRHPKVDAFMAKQHCWQAELVALRHILQGSPLTEEFKWYKPVYTFQDANLIAIAGLKDHCWISFFNGALLDDPRVCCTPPRPQQPSGAGDQIH